jgi:hypothetical protein
VSAAAHAHNSAHVLCCPALLHACDVYLSALLCAFVPIKIRLFTNAFPRVSNLIELTRREARHRVCVRRFQLMRHHLAAIPPPPTPNTVQSPPCDPPPAGHAGPQSLYRLSRFRNSPRPWTLSQRCSSSDSSSSRTPSRQRRRRRRQARRPRRRRRMHSSMDRHLLSSVGSRSCPMGSQSARAARPSGVAVARLAGARGHTVWARAWPAATLRPAAPLGVGRGAAGGTWGIPAACFIGQRGGLGRGGRTSAPRCCDLGWAEGTKRGSELIVSAPAILGTTAGKVFLGQEPEEGYIERVVPTPGGRMARGRLLTIIIKKRSCSRAVAVSRCLAFLVKPELAAAMRAQNDAAGCEAGAIRG